MNAASDHNITNEILPTMYASLAIFHDTLLYQSKTGKEINKATFESVMKLVGYIRMLHDAMEEQAGICLYQALITELELDVPRVRVRQSEPKENFEDTDKETIV